MGWRVVVEGCGENGHSQALLRLLRQFGPLSDSKTYGQNPKTGFCKPQQSHTAFTTILPLGNLSSTPNTGLHFSNCRFKHRAIRKLPRLPGAKELETLERWCELCWSFGIHPLAHFLPLSFLQPRGGGSWPLVFEDSLVSTFILSSFPVDCRCAEKGQNCGLDVVLIMGTQNTKANLDWMWKRKLL